MPMHRSTFAVLAVMLGGCAREPAPSVPMVAAEERAAPQTTKASRNDRQAGAPRPRPIDEDASGDPSEEVLRSIRAVSPTEHVITRRGADLFLENQPTFLGMVSLAPQQQNGRVSGLRLFGIRPETFLGRIGFENGDVLERIGGKAVDTPEKALETYAALRNASVIDIDIVRRGAPMRLVLRIE